MNVGLHYSSTSAMEKIERIGATESDDYSTDEGKRKREGDQSDPFSKSKKVVRSPHRAKKGVDVGGERERETDNVMVMLKELLKEVQAIRKENHEFKQDMADLKKENRELKLEVVNLQTRVQKLEKVEQRIERIEKESKLNKVVIKGMPMKDNEHGMLKEKVEEFIKSNLQVEVKTKTAFKINRSMCVVEFESWGDKNEVMQNKRKLKGMSSGRVFIDNDMTEQEREIQGKIRQVAAGERRQGRTVIVKYQRMVVDGVEWMWSRSENQLVLEAGERTASTKN